MIDSHAKALKLFGSSVSLRLAGVILGFVNSILINRYLGVELRGEYTTLLNYANLLQMLLNLGIGNSYPAFRRGPSESAQSLFLKLSLIQTFLYGFVIAVLVLFQASDAMIVVFALAVVLVVENQMTFLSLVENIVKRNLVQLLVAIVYTLALLLTFRFSAHSLGLLLAITAVNSIVNSIALYCACIRKERSRAAIKKSDCISVFRVSIPVMFMNLLMFCNYNLDIVLLDLLSADNVQIGLYGTAVFLESMIWKIPDAVKEVLYSRAARGNNATEIIACIIVNCAIAVLVVFIFVAVGKWALGFFYGEDFVLAYPLVLLLLVGTIPMILYKMIHPIYIANKKPGVVALILSLSVILNIAGNLILIPAYSALGAAIASVVSYSFCGLLCLLKFFHDFKFDLRMEV